MTKHYDITAFGPYKVVLFLFETKKKRAPRIIQNRQSLIKWQIEKL